MWKRYIKIASDLYPAPVLDIDIYHKGTRKSASVSMKIDTGSSSTVLPLIVIKDDLNAKELDRIECTDFNGNKNVLPVFSLNLIIQGNTFQDVEVIGSDNPTYGLIGRDILYRYMLRCDGPGQKFELDLLTI